MADAALRTGMIPLKAKLLARRFMRASGGYGVVGFAKAYFKICVIGTASLMALFLIQLSLCDWQSACLRDPSETLITLIITVIFLCAGVLAVRQFLIEPLAQSIEITPELNELATDFKVPEAALSLSELHGQRGADAHATIWWERAAALNHPATKNSRNT